MAGRIPLLLQGNRYIHQAFWFFGLYASDKEEEIVTSYKTYRKNPTQRNWKNYQSKHHWISEWAEKNVGIYGSYKAMFIPPLDSRPRVQLMQKVRLISELENPYFQSLKDAEEEFNKSQSAHNTRALEEIKNKFNHVVLDWKVETGVLERDPRGVAPEYPERPKDLPYFPFPTEGAKKYSYHVKGHQMRIMP